MGDAHLNRTRPSISKGHPPNISNHYVYNRRPPLGIFISQYDFILLSKTVTLSSGIKVYLFLNNRFKNPLKESRGFPSYSFTSSVHFPCYYHTMNLYLSIHPLPLYKKIYHCFRYSLELYLSRWMYIGFS